MTNYEPAAWWSPQPAVSHGWWRAAVWIPTGFAATRFLGHDTPLLAVVFLAAALAGLHHVLPSLVELLAGGGGLLISLFTVSEGTRCGDALGHEGVGAVLLFGAIMTASSFIRLLGSASIREMARHLLVATASLELGLFALSPVGRHATTAQSRFTVPALLLVTLLLTTVLGVRRRRGFVLLGIGLVTVLCVLALTGSPCSVNPVVGLAGSLSFAGAALFLAQPVQPDRPPLTPRRPRYDDRHNHGTFPV